MISRLRGKIISRNANQVELRVGDIVYEVSVPSYLQTMLMGGEEDEVEFYILEYLENAGGLFSVPRLVGFLNPSDREFFRLFLKVPGFGVKSVLKAMVVVPSELATLIEKEDKFNLSQLPGVGKKSAEKIIAELKGQVKEFIFEGERIEKAKAGLGDEEELALKVLIQLGFKRAEAIELIQGISESGHLKSEEIVQKALKLSGSVSSKQMIR